MTVKSKTVETSPRILGLKYRLTTPPIELDLHRARVYTKVWKESHDVGPAVRAARALEETLRTMAIAIHDDELFVGIKTEKPRSPIMAPERSVRSFNRGNTYDGGTEKGGSRTRERRESAERTRQGTDDDIWSYWSTRCAQVVKHQKMKERGWFDAERQAFWPYEAGVSSVDTQGHVIPGYRRVLALGFNGIGDGAEKRLGSLEEKEDNYSNKKDFLEAVIICSKAVRDLSERYAALAEKMAEETAAVRSAELIEIAERCRRVPSGPPSTFMEALQSFWMTHVVLAISYGIGDVFSSGRVDQYLDPFYRADLAAGRITPEWAQEATDELHLKVATSVQSASYTLTIGGIDENGDDAVNDVSYMFLSALARLGAMRNNVSVRVAARTPNEFIAAAWKAHHKGAGVAFYNDEIIVRDLVADGYKLEDARDYSIVGCVEPTTTGKEFSYTAGNWMSIVRALEFALNGGCRFGDEGRLLGAPTPPPAELRTFEDVRSAYEQQLAFCVALAAEMGEVKDAVYAEGFPAPLLSATIEGCLESGLDVTRGGAVYNNGNITAQSLGTVANSLAAVKWAVYDNRLLTLEEMVQHLRENFEGAESLRYELMRKAPKFGNDDPDVDEIASWVTSVFCREVRSHKCGRGGLYRPLLLSSGHQIEEGLVSNATADGRLAGEPLTDGISPAHGTEMKGLTAVLHSAAAVSKELVTDGTTLTLNLSPLLLKSDESVDKLTATLRAYFILGGRHVQFTPLDRATLLDAQSHPEKYPDLSVKVSGYSAIFVDLPRSLQNDIIGRTEWSEV